MRAALLMGGATVAGAAVAFSLAVRRSNAAEMPQEEADDVEELPEIPPEKVVAIFSKLCSLMNANISQVMRRINAQGGQVPQAMLAQYLVEHFETQLRELQTVVFKEFEVTEEDLEDAVDFYEGEGEGGPPRDANVAEAVNQLRQLYVNVGGSLDLELPVDLTVEKMCVVFEEYMSAVVEAQTAFTQQLQGLKAKGGQITAGQLTEARQAKMQEKIGVVLKKHNLNALLFQVPRSWTLSSKPIAAGRHRKIQRPSRLSSQDCRRQG